MRKRDSHLGPEEHAVLQIVVSNRASVSSIARYLSRSASPLSRELLRHEQSGLLPSSQGSVTSCTESAAFTGVEVLKEVCVSSAFVTI